MTSPQARWRSLPPEGAVRLRPGEAGSAAGSLIAHVRVEQFQWE
jgi:hypothetical protein